MISESSTTLPSAATAVCARAWTPPGSPVDALGYPHPIIRVIPDSGEEALFLGRRTNGYVMGLPLDDSEQLLDELWAHATQERFCYRHRWQVGQVVVWDNRRLMHMRYQWTQAKALYVAHADQGRTRPSGHEPTNSVSFINSINTPRTGVVLALRT